MLKLHLKNGSVLEIECSESTYQAFRKWLNNEEDNIMFNFRNKFNRDITTVMRCSIDAFTYGPIDVESIWD